MTTPATSPPWTVARPRLLWAADGTPESLDFGDVFGARAGAADEVRHVLLAGLGAPAVWQRPGPFVLAETGFGTGLACLVTVALWAETAPPDARLHWLSVEGYPLTRAEAARALAGVRESLAPWADRLLAVWPPPLPGLFLRRLDARVTLTVAHGPVEAVLPALAGAGRLVDAWHLDGFAPARNPAMWSPAVLTAVARLARPGARLATYTAAGAVRRGLEDAGFAMTRRPGFGAKREALHGTRRAVSAADPVPDRRASAGPSVVIVGAGIAGCCVAEALTRFGGAGSVTVLDARGHPAQSLPPHLLGLTEPRLENAASAAARLHAAATMTAAPLYDALAAAGPDPWRGPRGLVSVDRGRRGEAWRESVVARLGWPAEWLRLIEADEAAERLGGLVPPGRTALWHPQAGALAPAVLLPALLGNTPVRAAAVDRLEPVGGPDGRDGWRLWGADGALLAEADVVILATATDTARLWPAAGLPLRPTRGQISVLEADGPRAAPRVAVSGPVYATPAVPLDVAGAVGWGRVLGATQEPWRPGEGDPFVPRPDDDARLRARLAAGWPALAETLATAPTVGALAGLRATTPDHLPLAGPLIDPGTLALRFGARLRRDGLAAVRALPADGLGPRGLVTLSGLGSHGLTLAPLLAAHVAARVTGGPDPLPPGLAAAVHPARFAARALVRGTGPDQTDPQADRRPAPRR